MAVKRDIHDGTSLTKAFINPNDARAIRRVLVDGLTDARTQIEAAINAAASGQLVHPDNAALPLRTATGRLVRGGSDSEALVALEYSRRGSSKADSGSFSTVALVDIRMIPVLSYAKADATWSTDETEDVIMTVDPNDGVPKPTQETRMVPIWDIKIPVTLSSSAISTVAGNVGTVNDGNFTIGGKAFSTPTLLFAGLNQRTSVFDGPTYEHDTMYHYLYRADGWYTDELIDDDGTPKALRRLMYETSTFATPPTS